MIANMTKLSNNIEFSITTIFLTAQTVSLTKLLSLIDSEIIINTLCKLYFQLAVLQLIVQQAVFRDHLVAVSVLLETQRTQ